MRSATLGRSAVRRPLGVLVLVAFLSVGGRINARAADLSIDFDGTGPTSTDDVLTYFDLLGFAPDVGTNWTIDPNTVNPENGSNAGARLLCRLTSLLLRSVREGPDESLDQHVRSVSTVG